MHIYIYIYIYILIKKTNKRTNKETETQSIVLMECSIKELLESFFFLLFMSYVYMCYPSLNEP